MAAIEKPPPPPAANLLNAFAPGGVPNSKISEVAMPYLGELFVQGKLNLQQIIQLKGIADKRSRSAAGPSDDMAKDSAFKSTDMPMLNATPGAGYPISQTLTTTDPGPVVWPAAQQGRPTLTAGISGGRMSGTPAQIRGPDDPGLSSLDESRPARKNTPGEQSMRRTIQDLASSIDPNVKLEPEVEDLLLTMADEFIDSVTNFSCRLAKHRGGDTLEVRDMQLHLERNHNIRIPGFASDETRLSLSQSTTTTTVPAAPPAKKAGQGTHMTLRSHRLAQVQQAKREGKLI